MNLRLLVNVGCVVAAATALFAFPLLKQPFKATTPDQVDAEVRQMSDVRRLRARVIHEDSCFRSLNDALISYGAVVRGGGWFMLACGMTSLVLLLWRTRKP